MTDYTPFRLPSGAKVYVQSSLHPPDSGIDEVSGISDNVRETWEDGVDLVRELSQGIVSKLQAATASAKEVTVEMGVNISGKAGIVLVEGSAGANLKITIKW